MNREVIKMNLKFIRFGGLSSVRQKGYDPSMPTFHSPPSRRGIYAFVYPHIESFLLGCSVFDQRRMKRDPKGYNVWKSKAALKQFDVLFDAWQEDTDSEDLFKAMDDFRNANTFPATNIGGKVFEHRGNIWHHLKPVDPPIRVNGDWSLSVYDTFKKSFMKELSRMELHKKKDGIPFSKDHLEVFIEKV